MIDRILDAARLVTLLCMVAACGGGERNVTEPPTSEPMPFTLTVRPHSEDAAVAQQLGWTGGIPYLQVTIGPANGSGAARVVTTGVDGTVRMDALAQGSYRVSARRLLTEAELGRLSVGSDVVAFVGEETIGVGANTRTSTVELLASRRRSLVISEWAFTPRLIFGVGNYMTGGYMELYNNADTTVYLDGVLVGSAYSIAVELPYLSCAASADLRNDPAGAWALQLAAFPGSGREYPLAPGENVIVATDAIDHSVLFPGMLDLSGADFEFIGPADVDNPAVPNMIDVGTFPSPLGHGIAFEGGLGSALVVGMATDPAKLARRSEPVNGRVLQRFDRDRLLDVMTAMNTYYFSMQPPVVFCDVMIHPSLDREYGFLLHEGLDQWAFSISRKVLGTLPDGRPLLQHTRTSANDYHRTPRTPGVVK